MGLEDKEENQKNSAKTKKISHTKVSKELVGLPLLAGYDLHVGRLGVGYRSPMQEPLDRVVFIRAFKP